MKSAIIETIEAICGHPLHPAPVRPHDPWGGLMAYKKGYPKYLMDGEQLVGLNLANTRLNNKKWQRIEALPGLETLQALNLSDNKLTEFRLHEKTKSLLYLNLGENKLKRFEWPADRAIPEDIRLDGNPLETPPPEIVKQGRREVRKFLEELVTQGEEVVYEAKLLILGDAGAGKTTLARKLENPDAEMPDPVNDSTAGIEVRALNLINGVPPFMVHVWDFGGQEVYHATHQFFLTKRSLYVLLCDGRKEEQFDYWLQAQELYGKDSLLLLVVNQKGEMQSNLPMSDLRRDYPNVQEATPTLLNLKTDRNGIASFRNTVERTIRNLPHFARGEKAPKRWVAIRQHLTGLDADHLPLSEFRKICADKGIPERGRQDFLLDFLHNLGVFLHFSDVAGLDQLVILRPEWATSAVYRVLDHTQKKGDNGHFSRRDLESIWNCAEYADYFNALLLLMQKFELCYRTPEAEELYIVPSLLPDDPPQGYVWAEQDLLQMHYQYTFMPKGILSRLIVRQHTLLESSPVVWKRGAVFFADNARAEVVESHRDKRIKIRVNSNSRAAKALLQNIVRDINDINSGFHFNERMRVDEEIPCCCKECNRGEAAWYFTRSELDRAERLGEEIQCRLSFKMVPVQQILDGVFPTEEGALGKSKKPALDKVHLKDLLRANELEQALAYIEDYDQYAAILLSARIAAIRKATNMGLESPEEQTRIRLQCIKTVLDWMEER